MVASLISNVTDLVSFDSAIEARITSLEEVINGKLMHTTSQTTVLLLDDILINLISPDRNVQ